MSNNYYALENEEELDDLWAVSIDDDDDDEYEESEDDVEDLDIPYHDDY